LTGIRLTLNCGYTTSKVFYLLALTTISVCSHTSPEKYSLVGTACGRVLAVGNLMFGVEVTAGMNGMS